MAEQKNIPELRFHSYEGRWINTTIKEIAAKITDGTHDTPKPVKNGVPYLTAIHVQNGYIDYENCYYLPQHEHDKIYKRCNPEKGDLLLVNIGAGTANCAINKVEYEFSLKNVALIKPNKNFISPSFLEQYQRNNRDRLFLRLTAGGAQPFFSLKEIGKIKLAIPSLPEQQKIASFFTAIDQKISQLKQKRTLLEQYKKGVMQKIFSQEIRFRDDNGQEFPEWEKKRLGDIGKTFNGLTGKSKDDFGDGKPYIQYKQIFDDSKIDISRFGFVKINVGEKQNFIKYGDVLFTTSSETPDEVGTSSVLLDKVDEVYLNSFCFGFRSNHSLLSPLFSRYLFRNELFRKEINRLAQGSTRYNISKNGVMKLAIALPSYNEQTKIADFLSAIDNKINHTQTQIEKAELWKKGLLQKMFV